MSSFTPFVCEPKVLFEGEDGFVVVFGEMLGGKSRVGMRWSKSNYPTARSGDIAYFLLSEELDLSFIVSLLGGKNDENIKNAIKTIIS
ncbi:hypothetical protein LMG7974_01294 [Campylobacter majalis]|uniref:Uncharacterized protein n=1 Tax=Campylobacter majalis TaxID=2790656 RepID=A0ABM8Q7Z2_9BACT|nr:hypothetical protein [Campylobacter majalis]CAD7289006.1 hypothetical protein LMG7974_01294 [Campylobacter majalis]